MQPGDLWQHKLDDDKFILILKYNSVTKEALVTKINSRFVMSPFEVTAKHLNVFWKQIA